MRHEPRRDSRGILDPDRLLRQVRFRRRLPDPALRPYVEHYWLIDWALDEPFDQRVVPHPAVNVVFQAQRGEPESAEIAGVGLELFTVTLHGVGRVTGVQFRPGGFRPFWRRSVAELTGRRRPLPAGPFGAGPFAAGPVCPGTDDDRCRRLDDLLTAGRPEPDPLAAEATALVEEIRADRSILRVDDFARRHGVSTRRLQRLFTDHVGVGPKWVIRRYRLQEAIEQAAAGPLDWSRVAADLGYADQAHLVREFTAVAGVSPAAYARSLASSGGR
ncbi:MULTISPECIES: AraC family transcriptional regulator [Micromonospora]|uniref:AraC family transcriptional regulator n=1 Tax=Micromonospora solifontis TaxID=2487138 RepID=A0ABX9WDK7_9ACTN|nr:MULTISPECIES: AraC family transcriptional regulator [Micromonospora]NES15787.1 helix-turn-helix transcriptional regulator [Micromonospora sp. PPF5-17B]NES38054.1 helix-turn-helix transcriptional regulator [Micromonospora solifontis]NES56633.1 helix-turn-helix transcriptional regulator [Micromonospora sp. PPF5-6]RNL97061.1 AraC family transcriptional regulator [Micromonospora solifontis]